MAKNEKFVKELAYVVFSMMPTKPSKLTGNEVKFIRVYLGKTKSAFGKFFKLSHTAISNWEKAEDRPAPISLSQEMMLRLYIEDHLNRSVREFYKERF